MGTQASIRTWFKDPGFWSLTKSKDWIEREKIKGLYPKVDIYFLPHRPNVAYVPNRNRDISTIEEPPEQRYPVQTCFGSTGRRCFKMEFREAARKAKFSICLTV